MENYTKMKSLGVYVCDYKIKIICVYMLDVAGTGRVKNKKKLKKNITIIFTIAHFRELLRE